MCDAKRHELHSHAERRNDHCRSLRHIFRGYRDSCIKTQGSRCTVSAVQAVAGAFAQSFVIGIHGREVRMGQRGFKPAIH